MFLEQLISMQGSCDTEDRKIQLCRHNNKRHFKDIKNKKPCHFKLYFYCIFDQLIVALVSV